MVCPAHHEFDPLPGRVHAWLRSAGTSIETKPHHHHQPTPAHTSPHQPSPDQDMAQHLVSAHNRGRWRPGGLRNRDIIEMYAGCCCWISSDVSILWVWRLWNILEKLIKLWVVGELGWWYIFRYRYDRFELVSTCKVYRNPPWSLVWTCISSPLVSTTPADQCSIVF